MPHFAIFCQISYFLLEKKYERIFWTEQQSAFTVQAITAQLLCSPCIPVLITSPFTPPLPHTCAKELVELIALLSLSLYTPIER